MRRQLPMTPISYMPVRSIQEKYIKRDVGGKASHQHFRQTLGLDARRDAYGKLTAGGVYAYRKPSDPA
jgi:hypothetical protein